MPEATEIIPKTYRKQYFLCRAQGHEWQHIPELADHHSFRFVKGLQSECMSCGTVRTRWVHANGRRFGTPNYQYADGYQLSKKKNPELIRQPTMQEWRGKYVRTLGFREEDTNGSAPATKTTRKKIDGGNTPRPVVA